MPAPSLAEPAVIQIAIKSDFGVKTEDKKQFPKSYDTQPENW